MNRLLNFPLLLLVFSFSSCIEFEREKLTYVHDEEKDELRVTLTYEGIFGNFAKGKNSQNGPDDVTTKDSLNQKQIEQWIWDWMRLKKSDYKKAIKYLDNYPDQADAQLLVKSPIPEIPENR